MKHKRGLLMESITRGTVGLAGVAAVIGTGSVATLNAQAIGTNTTVIIERPLDGARLEFSPSDLTTMVLPFVAADSTPLDAIFLARSIYPDAEAYAAVYDLNPGFGSTVVPPDMQVSVPSLDIPVFTPEVAAAGFRFFITLNVQLKASILDVVDELGPLVTSFAMLGEDRFQSPASRESAIDAARTVYEFGAVIGAVIERRSRPLQADFLRSVEAELDVLRNGLRAVAEDSGTVDESVVTLLGRLSASVESRTAYFAESHAGPNDLARYPVADLSVRVVDSTGADVQGLRVYYVSPGLFGLRDPYGGNELRSPTSLQVDVANWRLWAGRSPDGAPSTEVFTLTLNGREEQPVKISLRMIGR